MFTDTRIYNGTTRQWLETPRQDVALVTRLTFWEPRTVDGETFYQTFEGHIYRYGARTPVEVCGDCMGTREVVRADGAPVPCGECDGRGYYMEVER